MASPHSPLSEEEEMEFDSSREEETNSSDEDDMLFSVSFSKSQPGHPSATSSHSGVNPPSRSGQASPTSLSPMVSPVKQRDERAAEMMRQKEEADIYRRVLCSAESKIERIEQLQALEGKTTDLMDQGGIIGMAKRLKSISGVEQDVEVSSSVPSSPTVVPVAMKEGVYSDPDIAVNPPGIPLFVHPPSLMETLVSPAVTGRDLPSLQVTLFHTNPTALREAVVGGWLSLLYCSKPCPMEVMDWLLEVTCLSPDFTLRESAFQSFWSLLPGVLQSQGKQQNPLSLERIFSVLVKLGADREKVESAAHLIDGPDGVSQQMYPQDSVPVLCGTIRTITCLLIRACTVSMNLYSFDVVQKLVWLLLKVSLDPVVCGHGLNLEISKCLNSLVLSLSEDNRQVLRHKLAGSAPLLFPHHHNQLHVAETFSYSFPDLRPFQRLLLRSFLQAAIASGAQGVARLDEMMDDSPYPQSNSEADKPPSDTLISDSDLALQVMVHYCRIPVGEIDYHQLHSIGLMLSIFLQSPEMHWSDAHTKEQFHGALSHLCSVRIKDSISAPVRGPVKDLLIRLRMELQSQNESGNLRQRDLFGHFIH